MNSHAPNSRSLEAEFHQIVTGHSAFKEKASSRQCQPWLKKWTRGLVDFLTGVQTLSIRERTRKDGTSQWLVYEAASDTRHVFDTEQDVRVWLEKKY